MGREPVEILRLAAGLWYTERRDLVTALYILLRVSYSSLQFQFIFFLLFGLKFYIVKELLQAVVLDQGLGEDIMADIQKYLEDLINAGLRQRLITLIKVCTL